MHLILIVRSTDQGCSAPVSENKMFDLRNHSLLHDHSANPVFKATSEVEFHLTFNSVGSPMASASSSHYFQNLLCHLCAFLVSPISGTFPPYDFLRLVFYGQSTIDSKIIRAANPG
jgi:hypothetical protein